MRHRSAPRLKAAFNASYCMADETMLRPCRVIDISRFGSRIAMIAKQELESGARIELHIEIPDSERRIVAMFNCVWSRRTPDADDSGGYEVGGFFTEVTPEDRNLLLSCAEMQA